MLDQDDVWYPNKISVQVDYLINQPELDFVLCMNKLRLEPGVQLPAAYDPGLLERPFPAYIPSALLARPAAFAKVGLFDTTLQYGGDHDWLFRAADLGVKSAVVPQALFEKRIHDSNLSHRRTGMKHELFEVLHRSIQRKRQGGGNQPGGEK